MVRFIQLLSALMTGILYIAGCSLNPLTSKSVDEADAAISAESVGEIAFQSINETRSTRDLLLFESPAPASLLEQPAIPHFTVDTKLPLGKKNAATAFSIDTTGEVVRITLTTSGILQTKYDTIEAVFDETVFDGIDGNESLLSLHGSTVYTNGTIESYDVKDRDGDGIINGIAAPQRVSLQLCTSYTKNIIGHTAGEVVFASFEADAGADNSFDAPDDNRLFTASWVKTNNGDTLAYAFIEDADGDGIIATAGPGTVNVSFFEKDNPLKPLVDYGKACVRIERDNQGMERTVRFTAEEKLVTGRLNRVWVVDETGDSTLDKGEKAYVHFATNSPAVADSEITAQALFVIDPGKNIGDVSDNLLHEITLAKSYRIGQLDSLTFHCAFNPAVPNGQDPTGGAFELDATFHNGKSASLVGAFENSVIEATFTGPEGNETEVVLKKGK